MNEYNNVTIRLALVDFKTLVKYFLKNNNKLITFLNRFLSIKNGRYRITIDIFRFGCCT